MLGPEHARLSVESVDGTPHVWLAKEHARVVHHVSGGEVVRPGRDQVVAGEDLHHVVGVEGLVVHDYVDQRVDLVDAVASRLSLGPANVGLSVDYLALEVGLVHRVVVDDPEGPNARGGQVHESGRTEATGANAKDLRRLQPLLTGHGDVRDDQ